MNETHTNHPESVTNPENELETISGTRNPVDAFIRVWRITERVVMTASVVLVTGTIGYVSIHALM